MNEENVNHSLLDFFLLPLESNNNDFVQGGF